MEFKELQTRFTTTIQNLKNLGAQLGKEHAESASTVAFVKTAFTREILEKKERIPGAIITTWFLILIVACYDWTFGMNWSMVFNLGVLPLLVYYIVRSIKDAPSS
ncbi:MAG: hypothetical protein ACU843_04785 [Gammaproteobacteria bacterium]